MGVQEMNPLILLLIILMTINNWQTGLGILTGMLLIYGLQDNSGRIHIIKKLTSWGWGLWD